MAGDLANSVLNPIADQVIKPLVNAIGRQFGYLFFYKRNIKNLEEKVNKLENSRVDAERLFEARSQNNEERAEASAGWLNEVKDVTQAAHEIVKDRDKLKGWCVNLRDRYMLSRKSTKLASKIRELQDEAPKGVATNPAVPAARLHGASSNDASKYFKSRTEIMDKVMEALKDDTVNIIGICGLGGIGKTTILHEVRERARTEKLFDEVPMTTVSQDPSLFNIQRDLASMLGLTDMKDERNIIARADLLHKRLTNGNKILVILDDVWSIIELEKVGIPVRNDRTKCKVVLASRDKRVCTSIGTEKTISVEELSKEEAWDMFKKKAGDCVEKKTLKEIAKKVVKECGGLPIALLTLASALSDKKREVWEDALKQLRQSCVTSIPEMNEKVYSSLRLSYDFLKGELPEAQPLLLICCQHPEDAVIKVEKLARYCLALELFEKVDKVVDARNRTYTLIDHLKSCFLLQGVDVDEEKKDSKYETVKMHDVVRDVCLSIVSEMKKERDKVYMHIMAQDADGGYDLGTSKVDFPKLKLLMEAPLDGSLLDNSFLQQMEELRVFENIRECEHELPPALEVLSNLRMLSLERKSLSEEIISKIGSLTRLEILSFWRSDILSFPSQIGQLRNLKLLDLRCGEGEGPVPSGILSGLKKLEVLCMGNFQLLGVTKDKDIQNGENYGLITELDSLSNLTTLQINLDPNDLLDLQRFRFENLKSFFFGSFRGDAYKYRKRLRLLVRKTIKLGGLVGMKWVLEAKIESIVKSTVNLELKDIEDCTDSLRLEKFVSLSKLALKNCKHLKFIIGGGSLGELRRLVLEDMPEMRHLWVGPIDVLCLGNLIEVKIDKCPAIECLFPHSAAKCLEQLQVLSVNSCERLEEIFSKGESGTTSTSTGAEIRKEPHNDFIVLFPKLRKLILGDLPQCGGFYNLKLDDGTVEQPLLNPLVMLPSLGELKCDGMHKLKQIVGGGMLEVSKLDASDWPQNLEEVNIRNCDSLETVFNFEGLCGIGENAHVQLLGQLKSIELLGLPNLEHLCRQIPQGIHTFQNLQKLEVYGCHNLGYLISSTMADMLVNLETLIVESCKSMKEVVEMNEDCASKKIVFRSLSRVRLEGLENLSSFCSSDQQSFDFPSLNSSNLQGFNNLKLDDGRVQQPLFNPLVKLPSFKELNCYRIRQLKQIVGGGMLELSKLAASDWLQNVEVVIIRFCDSLETVFNFEGLCVMGENAHVQLLGQLKSLQLERLPNLEHLCRQIPQGIHTFQNLQELAVNGCDNLGYLISSTMAHMLVNLKSLSVRWCKSMKEVVEMNENCALKKIVFRSLSIVELTDNEELSSFCSSEQHSFEFPSLVEGVYIYNCPKIKTFCCGHITAEKLIGVKPTYPHSHDYYTLIWKGDLNETVRQLNARVNQTNGDLEEDDVPEEGIADEYAECTNEDDIGSSNSIPHDIGSSSSIPLEQVHDIGSSSSIPHDIGSSSSFPSNSIPHDIGSSSSIPLEQVHDIGSSSSIPHDIGSSSSFPSNSIPHDIGSSSSIPHDIGSSSSIPLEQGTPMKDSRPLSVVSSPNVSLTPVVVSPSPPVSDNNEELANSSSPDLRKDALPSLIEFVPSTSMEHSVHSNDSPLQPKADKVLSNMSLSSQEYDWKKCRILIQGVYIQDELKTTFEEILTAKPNFLSGLRLKTAKMKTDVMELAIRSLQILRQRTALTISLEELADIKDSIDDLESIGIDTAWLERGYQRAILLMKGQKAVSAAAELAMLEREKTEDEVAFEMARAKLEASTARRDAFKTEYGAIIQELEAGKELFGGGFDLETSLGDGLLD